MGFKIWAYIAASVGIVVSIWICKNKQWKYGSWIFIASLSVFFSGSLHIDKIIGISGELKFLNNEVKAIGTKVERTISLNQELKSKTEQVLALNQKLSQNIIVVNKIEKEIVNIKEAIHQQYASFKVELFKEEDLDKKVRVFPNPVSPNNKSIIFFELGNISEKNSVTIADRFGVAPSTSYDANANLIILRRDIVKDKLFKEKGDYYEIKYIPISSSDERLKKVKDMEFQLLEDSKYNVNFNFKDGKE